MRTVVRLQWLSFAIAAMSFAGCIRIDRQTTAGSVPQAVLGAWNGSWSSAGGGGNGAVTLRVQTFEAKPVVQIDSDVPCLLAGSFEFRLSGSHIELRRNGSAVLTGDIDLTQRRITGTYSCAQDTGSWDAAWLRPLPEVGDVTGSWGGEFQVGGSSGLGGAFTMALEQSWQNGFLLLGGEVTVTGSNQTFAIDTGNVNFGDQGFELLLRGIQPGATVMVQGVGSLQGTASCNGLLLLESAGSSFAVGSWTATRTGP